MPYDSGPWESIFQREGHVFPEPFPRFEELIAAFQQHRCRRILDLGSGTGRHVVHLVKNGFQVVGLDQAPTGLRLTRQWLAEERLTASLVRGDMRRPFPFGDGVFDGLLSTQVIHHAVLATVRRTIAEMLRVLRVGGVLFVTVPARKDEDAGYEEIEPNTFVPVTGHEKGLPHHIFAPEELRAEFSFLRLQDLSVRGSAVLALLGVKVS